MTGSIVYVSLSDNPQEGINYYAESRTDRPTSASSTDTSECKYECDFCDRRFNQDVRLEEHKHIHTGERPYVCKVCQKCFGTSTVLRHHEQIHDHAGDNTDTTIEYVGDIPHTRLKGGTGMIASSSTFCPHLGRVIRDLFRLLDSVYGIVQEH